MIVREAISFEKNKDPKKSLDVGKYSEYAREQKFKELQKDVQLRFTEISGKQLFLEKIYEIEDAIKKLKDINVSIKSINSSFNSITFYLNSVSILNSNHVLFHCASQEDAKFLIYMLKKFSMRDDDNFSINKDDTSLYLRSIDEFVDDLKESREEFSKYISESLKYTVRNYKDL